MLTIFIDPAVALHEKQRELILRACAEVDVKVDFVPQRVEGSISWVGPPSSSKHDPSWSCDIEQEVLVVLKAEDAVSMIHAHSQSRKGEVLEQITLTEWVASIQSTLPGKNVTIIAVGLGKYVSNLKTIARQQHRELVTGQPSKGKKKAPKSAFTITTQDVEEALVDVQLLTGCIVHQVASDQELAAQIKLYCKAVAEKPKKKDRLDNVFSFLEEGKSGLSVNKSGEGLLKVWKHQLMQFKNFGAEMADAVVKAYPSPVLLHKACEDCRGAKEAATVIGEINVRRSASVISTNRKIGKEHARRVHTLMTSKDPEEIIK